MKNQVKEQISQHGKKAENFLKGNEKRSKGKGRGGNRGSDGESLRGQDRQSGNQQGRGGQGGQGRGGQRGEKGQSAKGGQKVQRGKGGKKNQQGQYDDSPGDQCKGGPAEHGLRWFPLSCSKFLFKLPNFSHLSEFYIFSFSLIFFPR
ncbi:hypothetical protein NN561_010917 [Cricetulus griseus]